MAHRANRVAAIVLLAGATVRAQQAPRTQSEVARPGGKIAGAPPLALVKIADGFNDPTNVASANDGSGRLFVVERVGRVKIVDKDGKQLPQPFLDLTKINPLGTDVQTGFVEQGLYAIAFHPNFRQNGYFYVHYSSLPFNGAGVVVRFQVDPRSPNVMTPERTNQSSKVILRMTRPYYNHNGGEIEFGPDGYLYIASGDGGWEGDPLLAGQDLGTYLGKILRIDINTQDDDTIPYKIPPTNPFARASDERLMQCEGGAGADAPGSAATGAPPAAGGAGGQGRGRGTGPVPAPIENLNNPHGVWLDTRDAAKPMLLVADRGNRRIVRYTLDDKPVDIVEGTLAPCAFHTRNGVMVVPDLQSRVTLYDQSNKVITHLGDGAYAGRQNQLRVARDRSQFEPGKFITPHGAWFDHAGNIFVGEWVEIGRVTKLRKV